MSDKETASKLIQLLEANTPLDRLLGFIGMRELAFYINAWRAGLDPKPANLSELDEKYNDLFKNVDFD